MNKHLVSILEKIIFVCCCLLLLPQTSQSAISKEQLSQVVLSLQNAYPDLSIIVNNSQPGKDFWWELNEKQASYSNQIKASGEVTHFIFFFGGLARMPEVTVQGAALILCHELGHGIGGAPFKDGTKTSVEGQADYFATRDCLSKVLANQFFFQEVAPMDPLNICTTELCRHIFAGIQSELAVINDNNPEQAAQFGQTDATIVNAVNTNPWFYPSNQCRLDTMIAGALQKERPRCWWAP